MRALVITNMYPSAQDPARGVFVRDQVRALEALGGVELELFAFASHGASAYADAMRQVRRQYRGSDFDVVHAHFGLNAWPSLALRGPRHAVTLHGTDLVHPRSRAITLAALPLLDLVAPVSESLSALVPSWARRSQFAILPCGVDTNRFHPIARAEARQALGFDQSAPQLLFAADPARPEKRFDRARELAGEIQLHALGGIDPEEVPLWINAANAVLVTSERESFGLAVLEALACEVPVLATPVGIAPEALAGLAGCHCGPFDTTTWRTALDPLLAQDDPRVAGRDRAEEYSAGKMAERVLSAWRRLI
jgi:glycosyltransferase involved in cell wall biosynthesis